MSAKPLWPTLKFERVGRLDGDALDYVPRSIALLGKELQSSPQRPVDWAIGQLLKDLAESPAALKALNRFPRRAPPEKRALNMAVHHLALTRMKREAAANAPATVADAWGTRPSVVKELSVKLAADARIELDALVEACMARKQRYQKPADVLRDVDADMHLRAKLSWFKSRAAKPR